MALSLRTKLVGSFAGIVSAVGLVSMAVGVWLIASTIFGQARDKVRLDLASAGEVYREQLRSIGTAIELTALRDGLKEALAARRRDALAGILGEVKETVRLDLLSITDPSGTVILRSSHPQVHGDSKAQDPIVARALAERRPIFGTAILSEGELRKESEELAGRARIPVAAERGAERTSGLVMVGACPVLGPDRSLLGVLYGGRLLNRDREIVDKVRDILYLGSRYKGKEVGGATIFLEDLRIAMSLGNPDGTRAIGTRLPPDLYRETIDRGGRWLGTASIAGERYITAFRPIRDVAGRTIGMLSIGILEEPFRDLRREAIALFLAVAAVATAASMAFAFAFSRRLLVPIRGLVAASAKISRGDLSQDVEVTSRDELGELAANFNVMVDSLRDLYAKLNAKIEAADRELLEAHRRLLAKRDALLRSEKLASLGVLAAGVAHELNNPIGIMSMYAQIALSELQDPGGELADSLRTIVEQADKASRIVKNLLEFARQPAPQVEALQINDVVRRAISMIDHHAKLQDVELQAELAEGLPRFQGDPDKLQQVFVNIMINALQAMPDGGRLSVRTGLEADGHALHASFEDTGCGIRPEHRERLFDPFFSTKEPGQGTGLGLSVSHRIVEQHGGTIRVESEMGKGSTFAVVLPLAPEGGSPDGHPSGPDRRG